ncbi:hypothetical protein [Sporichthya polymorpha]|uniref:hypothetical protein n=1 Tax=Sporichthya polymorpha TaxID=35751 RepID=UPI0003701328|nr:hypothetical protein [Sporichthya polymorpha]
MSESFGGTSDEDRRLRALLTGLDPMSARVPVDPHTSPRARQQLEQIMSQNTEFETPVAQRAGRGKTWLAAAAAVAAIAVGTTVAVTSNGGEDGEQVVAAPTVMELQGNPSDPLMSMCLAFDVQQLAKAPVAFGGTVTEIGNEKVTLDVDRWYKGGNADVVTVKTPEGMPTAALDGVNWEKGQRYLISANDGMVDGCGYSGPASADFEKQFEKAFPAS